MKKIIEQVASFCIGVMLIPLKMLVRVHINKDIMIRLNRQADKYLEIYREYLNIKRVLDEVQEGKIDVLLHQLEALLEETRLEKMRVLKENLLFS